MIYIDTETPPIARARLAQAPVCVQSAIDDGPPRIDLWPTPIDLDAAIAGANVAYDMACLAVGDPDLVPAIFRAYDEGRIVDVLLDTKLLDIAAGEYGHRIAGGWSLEECARRAGYTIEGKGADGWRLRFDQLRGVPVDHWPAGAAEYALGDVAATRAVHAWNQSRRAQWQAHGIDPLGYHSAHAAASAWALHLCSVAGVYTDAGRVDVVEQRINAHLARMRGRLQRAGLVRANGKRDTKAAARAMIDACQRADLSVPLTDGAGKKADASADKRAAATTPKAIAKAAAAWHRGVIVSGVQINADQAILAGSRVLELYSEYTSANLLRGRVERLREGVSLPLQTRYDPLKETARTSSTQPADPLVGEQLQNFPAHSGLTPEERKREDGGEFLVGLRECFTPRPGYVFGICDFELAEMHTLAQLCLKLFGSSSMADLLNAGRDLHVAFGMSSIGRTYESYNPTVDKPHRSRAKPGNFGFPGGMGPDSFMLYARKGYGVRFTREQAAAARDQWVQCYPEMPHYLAWINSQLGDRDTFTHVHPCTGFVRGGCWYTSGANHGFQHLCAYGAKAALYAVQRECFDKRSALWGTIPWGFIHDEVIAEHPRDVAHDAAHRMGEIMTETFNRYVPDVPTRAAPVLSEVWSKHAKATCNLAGRLVPWAPT